MRKLFLLSVVLLALSAAVSPAQSLFDNVTYKGARSHPFDLLHIAADLRLDDAKSTVSGTVRHTMRSLQPGLASIRLDAAAAMTISAVTVDGQAATVRRAHDTLTVMLPAARAWNDTFTVAITYSIAPAKGMYFIRPTKAMPGRRSQVWTQGEGEDNRYWLPMYDYPNDRATTDMLITARDDWKVLSNGVLATQRHNNDHTITWNWRMDKPYSGYLIMIAAGDYSVARDTADGVPLEYWAYPEQADRMAATYGRTGQMIRFFNKMIGIPYPWPKYAQVMISEFMFGGMENTSATTLNDAYMVDERGRLDFNPDGVISHELGHQWYGNLIINRSWGHLWLHESYATYLQARFFQDYYGLEQFQKDMYDNGQAAVTSDKVSGRDPIVYGHGVTSNIYSRGARVLHMLNCLVGEDQFWRANRLFLTRCGYGLAETNDLKIAFEDATGQNLDWFFDQWVYKAGMPRYAVAYAHKGDTLRLYVRQTQQRDSLTGLFQMPVPVELYLADRVVRDTVWTARENDTFAIACPSAPRYVIFDAGDAVLKTVDFPRTDQELIAQLAAPRMTDRLLAVKELAGRPDSVAPAGAAGRSHALHDAFMSETSKFVREEIVRNGVWLDSAAARDVILKALQDNEVNVRKAALDVIYLLRDSVQRIAALRPLLADSSYSIVATAVTSLAQVDPKGLEPVLRSIKGVRGRRDNLALAWLNAVAAGRYNAFADDVTELTMSPYGDYARSQAFTVLAKLNVTTTEMRNAIVRGLTDNVRMVRESAETAARAHLDKDMRQMLIDLKGTLKDDQKKVIENILKKHG